MLIEKFNTGLWFLKRPDYWTHGASLIARKFGEDKDDPETRERAGRWAAEHAVSVDAALQKLGIFDPSTCSLPVMPDGVLVEAEKRAERCDVKMGGPGDLGLLFSATALIGARRIVETGVAYGWSSLALLAALRVNGGGRLISVDMPYPKAGNEEWVGVVVPEDIRSDWTLIRKPDRNGIAGAIRQIGGEIDLCHYDSDKSYRGRKFAYPILWQALRPGGIFISDDIQDNFAFKEFVDEHNLDFGVTAFNGKYVGVTVKPANPDQPQSGS